MNQNFSSFQNYQPGEDQEIPFVQIKNASYFRAKARNALKGKFINASVMAFLYQLIIGAVAVVSVITMYIGLFSAMVAGVTDPDVMLSIIFAPMVIAMVIAVAGSIFLGAPITVGYYHLNLNLLDGKDIGVETLFSYFKKNYFKTVKLYALYSLVLAAGFLPLFVGILLMAIFGISPGIFILICLLLLASCVLEVIFSFRYAMVFFILAEYPEMRVIDVMRSSANMMRGRKWKLFCLNFSFIGWVLLLGLVGSCTCGLASIVAPYPLMAYMTAAMAAFYDDAANREAARQAEFPSLDPEDYKLEEEKTDEA